MSFTEFINAHPEIKFFSHEEQWMAYDEYMESIVSSFE
jgi:hypothetical protein